MNNMTAKGKTRSAELLEGLEEGTVAEGEEVTKGMVILGKDDDDKGRAIGAVGAEKDELKLKDLDTNELLKGVLLEMRIMNTHLSMITGDVVKETDVPRS